MGRVGVVTLLLASLSIGACSSEQSFRVADGSSIRFSELHGDWVVLNYWAEWCAPCRKEIPELNELQDQAVEQGIKFRVFGVNYDGLQGADLDAVMERMVIDFPVLLDDPRQRFGIARAEVLPMTVIIDPNGKVKTILSGPQTAQSLLASVES
jgi:thiol-disulfide isomerase/thioredoxin